MTALFWKAIHWIEPLSMGLCVKSWTARSPGSAEMQAKKEWAITAILVERTFSLRRHSLLLVLLCELSICDASILTRYIVLVSREPQTHLAWLPVRYGMGFPNGTVIRTWHCMALTFAPLAILAIYGKYICILYLQVLQSCTALSKLAATEHKVGPCPEITYYLEIIPFP